jgi:hypothetical protein
MNKTAAFGALQPVQPSGENVNDAAYSSNEAAGGWFYVWPMPQ